MSNVLLISMYYSPEESGNAPYATGIAEHLAAVGHTVTVLTAMPHYPEWRVWPEYRVWSITQWQDGVRVRRRWTFVPRAQSALQRAAYEASFFASALPAAVTTTTDVVLGIVPSLSGGVLARIAAARSHSGYGVIFQDLIGAAALQTGIKGGRRAAWVARALERWVVSRATAVAPVTESFIGYLTQLGAETDRIHTVPNWAMVPRRTRDAEETRRMLGWDRSDWIVLHAGNMGLKQGLEQVVDAARVADRIGAPIRFVLMGDGNQRSAIEAMAHGVKRLTIRPFVPKAELPNVLAAADALLVSERATVIDMSLPSKLTAYFAVGQPIIAAVRQNGATAREVTVARAGVTTPAGDPAALVNAAVELRSDAARARHLGDNGVEYARTHLCRTETLRTVDNIVTAIERDTRAIRNRRHR